MKRGWTALGRWSVAAALLAAVVPAAVSADRPHEGFVVSGQITQLSDGDIKAAGQSGRFVVKNRTAEGLLYGSLAGHEFHGEPFALTFGTNVPLLSQSGQLHGTWVAGDLEATVRGTSQIGVTPIACDSPDGISCIPTLEGNFVPGVLFTGSATFTAGTRGRGTWDAWIIPQLEGGHIVGIHAGAFTLTGTWH